MEQPRERREATSPVARRSGVWPRGLAATLLGMQGLVSAAIAGLLSPAAVQRSGLERVLALATVAVLVAVAVALVGCARSVLRAPGRARLVAAVCQLLALVVAIGLGRGHPIVLAAVVAGAVVTVAVLFSPALAPAGDPGDDEAAGSGP